MNICYIYRHRMLLKLIETTCRFFLSAAVHVRMRDYELRGPSFIAIASCICWHMVHLVAYWAILLDGMRLQVEHPRDADPFSVLPYS